MASDTLRIDRSIRVKMSQGRTPKSRNAGRKQGFHKRLALRVGSHGFIDLRELNKTGKCGIWHTK